MPRADKAMTPQQWTLVERLYHEASSVPAPEREAWLSRACGGDDVVRREVESLLAQSVSTPGALDEGALAQTTGQPRENLSGQRLGGYSFLELIGEGGMGQVYRARDVALPRDVAVKVITPEFAGDPRRRARFRRGGVCGWGWWPRPRRRRPHAPTRRRRCPPPAGRRG